jgi:hypothetical protein
MSRFSGFVNVTWHKLVDEPAEHHITDEVKTEFSWALHLQIPYGRRGEIYYLEYACAYRYGMLRRIDLCSNKCASIPS